MSEDANKLRVVIKRWHTVLQDTQLLLQSEWLGQAAHCRRCDMNGTSMSTVSRLALLLEQLSLQHCEPVWMCKL